LFWFHRIKALQTEAFTQKDAEMCAGMGSFTAPKTFNTDLPTMDVEETSSTAETATQD